MQSQWHDSNGTPTHIVIGAGSAGAVIAARLSEDPRLKIVLIEAGADHEPLRMRMPAGVFGLIGNPRFDWCYPGSAAASLGGRSIAYPAGKVVGGSSAINGLVYARGDRADYASWVDAGAAGWGWDEVLPYFRKSETFAGSASQSHGNSGPIGVSQTTPHRVAELFQNACGNLQIPQKEDYSTGDIDGAFPTQATIRDGRRSSTRAFLKLAGDRKNLRILSRTQVEKIIVEDGRAVGVTCIDKTKQSFEIRARDEVVLAAGAFGTPLLLQRSGIGPGKVLQAAGVGVVCDHPEIGRNLRDHLSNGIARNVTCPTFNDLRNPTLAAKAGFDWLVRGSGPLASASVHAMAYGRSVPGLDHPDYMLSFLPVNTDWSSGVPRLARQRGVFVAVNTCLTQASGNVEITGPTSGAKPLIDYDLLAEEADLRALLAGLRMIVRLMKTEPLASVMAKEQPEDLPHEEDEWLTWLRDRTALGYHSVGTCRMGDDDAPVDPELRLLGVAGLRVADASVMPTLVSGNTNAAVMMIGERAADFIGQSG